MSEIVKVERRFCHNAGNDAWACGDIHVDGSGVAHACDRINSSTRHFTAGHLCGCGEVWE